MKTQHKVIYIIQQKIESIPELEFVSSVRMRGINLVSVAELAMQQTTGQNYLRKKIVSIEHGQNMGLLNVKVQKHVSVVNENTTPLYVKKQQKRFSL